MQLKTNQDQFLDFLVTQGDLPIKDSNINLPAEVHPLSEFVRMRTKKLDSYPVRRSPDWYPLIEDIQELTIR
jgi:hypothetical protein